MWFILSEPGLQEEWDRYDGENVIKDLVSKPSEADGKDIFNLGQSFDFNYDECEKKCEVTSVCVAYTQFATWYHNSEFYASCMGRSNAHSVLEPDDAVKSGVKMTANPGKFCDPFKWLAYVGFHR